MPIFSIEGKIVQCLQVKHFLPEGSRRKIKLILKKGLGLVQIETQQSSLSKNPLGTCNQPCLGMMCLVIRIHPCK